MVRKHLRLLFGAALLMLGASPLAAQSTWSLEIEEDTLDGLPALHSGAWATHAGDWVFIGGRTNGLHGFLPPLAFPGGGAHRDVVVYDPAAEQVWTASLNALPDSLKEPLSSSNLQFFQEGSRLYLVGGYGYSQAAAGFVTYNTLIAADLDLLIPAVKNGQPLAPAFRMIRDNGLDVCGGHLAKLGSTWMLVFGHRFEGIYDRSDTTGFFQQDYTYSVRRFELTDDGTQLSLNWLPAWTDSAQYRRRDYNLSPQVFPNGDYGYTAWSGVFQRGVNLPWLTAVDIGSSSAGLVPAFVQNLSHYHSAVFTAWDSTADHCHTWFFGGMAQYYLDSAGQVAEDTLVPFVNTISRVSRNAANVLTEAQLSQRMPGLLGTNAHFIPDPARSWRHDRVLLLDSVTTRSRAGWIVGGIESPQPNLSDTDPSLSYACPRVFEVWIGPQGTSRDLPVQQPFTLTTYPNPFPRSLHFDILMQSPAPLTVEVWNSLGEKVEDLYNIPVQQGSFSGKWDAGRQPAGVYYLRVRSGAYSETRLVFHSAH